MLEDPNYRSEHELQTLRDFKAAAAHMLGCKDRLVRHKVPSYLPPLNIGLSMIFHNGSSGRNNDSTLAIF